MGRLFIPASEPYPSLAATAPRNREEDQMVHERAIDASIDHFVGNVNDTLVQLRNLEVRRLENNVGASRFTRDVREAAHLGHQLRYVAEVSRNTFMTLERYTELHDSITHEFVSAAREHHRLVVANVERHIGPQMARQAELDLERGLAALDIPRPLNRNASREEERTQNTEEET